LYQPLPEFLSAAVHRDLRLALAPPHGDVARSTAVRLELAPVGGEEPLKLFGIHEYKLLNKSVEVNRSVNFLHFARP
jgi:hypothetical protein